MAGHLDHTPTADSARAIVESKAWPDHWGAEMALKDGYDAGRAFRVWHVLDYERRPITEIHYWRGFYSGEGWGKDRGRLAFSGTGREGTVSDGEPGPNRDPTGAA